MNVIRILSVQVGRPVVIPTADGSTMRTSLAKAALAGPTWLGPEDLEGNYQANRKYHGGPDKAVCCFASEHYPGVRAFLRQEVSFGAFGENFTLSGAIESDVSIGDRYRAGDAVVEVSQPRQPCSTLTRRYGHKGLLSWMIEGGVTGWYFRTIEEGLVTPGDELVLLERPHPRWTIVELNRLMFSSCTDDQAMRAVIDVEQLSPDWRQSFEKRLLSGKSGV